MLEALYYYFYDLFYFGDTIDGALETFSISLGNNTTAINSINLYEYLALICSLVSFIIIFVICCLFIYRLIRLVGRLFSGGVL